jgi:ATP-dependent Clp protease protease subunit
MASLVIVEFLETTQLPLQLTGEISQVRRQLGWILARHAAQSMELIREDTERDYFMSPRNAMEYGLIDDVLKRRES